MSTRRSARSTAAAARAAAHADSDGDIHPPNADSKSDYEYEEGAENDGSEDDGYESVEVVVHVQTTSKSRSAKKPRTAVKQKPAAAHARVQGRLKNFMHMPLDVIFEIFATLQPADLLSLARTSKSIRQILMSPAQTCFWKAVRANAPGVPAPDPPPDMSEEAWAQLLFGGSKCYTCKAKNIHAIVFELRRRVCKRCKKEFQTRNLYREDPAFRNPAVPGSPIYLKDLVGYIPMGRNNSQRAYWKPDLERMKQRVEELRANESPSTVTEFIERKAAQVKAYIASVPALYEWELKSKREASQNRDLIKQQNHDKLRSRMLAAGYPANELYSLPYAVDGYRELMTDKVLDRVQSKAVITILQERAEKVRQDAERRKSGRAYKAASFYHEHFLMSLITTQWCFLPSPQHLISNNCSQLPCLQRLVEDERDRWWDEIPNDEWMAAIASVPGEASAYLISYLETLSSALSDRLDLPTAFEFAPASEGSGPDILDALSQRFRLLDLAQSVSGVVASRFLIGSDALHGFCRNGSKQPTFSAAGASAACDIARLVKKPSMVTARELDITCAGMLFRCTTCPDSPGSLPPKRSYFDWRGYVTHCAQNAVRPHEPEPAPEGMFADTGPKHVSYFRQWVCTHCSEYSEQVSTDYASYVFGVSGHAMGSHSQLLEHNKTEHGIENPREHYDFFYYPSFYDLRPAPAVVKSFISPEDKYRMELFELE